MFGNVAKKIVTPVIGGQQSINNQIPTNLQSIRWWRVRRPIELGTSKSKLFFVHQKRQPNPEEAPDMQRLNMEYE